MQHFCMSEQVVHIVTTRPKRHVNFVKVRLPLCSIKYCAIEKYEEVEVCST
jgi:hypothetical protein